MYTNASNNTPSYTHIIHTWHGESTAWDHVCETLTKSFGKSPPRACGKVDNIWMQAYNISWKLEQKKKPTSDNLTWIWHYWPYPAQESPWCMMGFAYLTVGGLLFVKKSIIGNYVVENYIPLGSQMGLVQLMCIARTLHVVVTNSHG